MAATWKPPSQRGRNPPRSHLPSLVSNRAGLSFRLAWDRTRDQGPITGKRDSSLHLVVRLAGDMCVMIFRSLLIRVDALAPIRIGCSPCMKRCQHPARPLQYYIRQTLWSRAGQVQTIRCGRLLKRREYSSIIVAGQPLDLFSAPGRSNAFCIAIRMQMLPMTSKLQRSHKLRAPRTARVSFFFSWTCWFMRF